jgi:transcriptional regulator GlxA family with amidase domain
LRTQRPVKQIAEAAGFQNEKSFIRAFSQWTGSPPSSLRLNAANTGLKKSQMTE